MRGVWLSACIREAPTRSPCEFMFFSEQARCGRPSPLSSPRDRAVPQSNSSSAFFSPKFLASGLFCPLVPLPHKQQLVHVPVWFQQAPRWQPLQPQESSARRGKGRPFESGFQGVKRQVKTNNYSSFFGGSILLAKSWY